MSEWWTYRLSDFLMFSPTIYWRLVERYQQALWPLPWLPPALGLLLVALAASRKRWASPVVLLVLAALWAWVGWAFHWQRYAQINWAGQYLAVAFWCQAALLCAAACTAPHAGTKPATSLPRWPARTGLALAALGVLFYPLLSAWLGQSITRAEVFGLMPEPTALATLGLVLMLRPRWWGVLCVVPVLSLLVGAATAMALVG